MKAQSSDKTESSFRPVGWAAIFSGIIGMLAFGFLVYPWQTLQLSMLMGRAHDVGAIVQFLLMIPVASGLYKLANQRSPGMSRANLVMGVAAISFTVLFLLLIFPKILSEALYMFPQGVFGVWLMIACWRFPGISSRGLRWFGIVTGLGLALVGIFPVGYAIFVDTLILQIPAPSAEAIQKIPFDTPANNMIHFILYIGSFLGILTFPIWSILLGRKLLREKN
jgi:hypothetical protein